MSVAADMAKHIVGRAGSKVRNLEEISGARINVSKEELVRGQIIVELVGSERSRRRARAMIEDVIAADGARGDNMGRGGGGGGGGVGGGRYDDDRRRDRRSSRDRDYGSSNGGGRSSGRAVENYRGGFNRERDVDGRDGGGYGAHSSTSWRPDDRDQRECYSCGRTGHLGRDCPQEHRGGYVRN